MNSNKMRHAYIIFGRYLFFFRYLASGYAAPHDNIIDVFLQTPTSTCLFLNTNQLETVETIYMSRILKITRTNKHTRGDRRRHYRKTTCRLLTANVN